MGIPLRITPLMIRMIAIKTLVETATMGHYLEVELALHQAESLDLVML